MHPKQKLAIYAIGFVVVFGFLLMGVLTAAKVWFPPPLQLSLQPPGQQPRNAGFWRQLQRIFKAHPKKIRYRRSSKRKVRRVRRGSGGGVPRTVRSRQHLAYRETVLGYFIQSNSYTNNPAEALRQAQRSKLTGPWREYELIRLRTRILAYQFDENKDRSLLPTYKKAAVQAVESPFANFEDYFWAGHVYLYTKDPRNAQKYFDLAHDNWPARDSFYGYIYFFQMCLNAVNGRGENLLKQFDDFQAVFPDWLYVEIYVTELNELQKLYPDAALLWFLRGQIFQMVLNDANALEAFQTALRSGKLDRSMTAAATIQIDRIKQRQ